MLAWFSDGVIGTCEWQPKRRRPGRRTRPCSRPLRARDRWLFDRFGGALAAADGQAVGRRSVSSYSHLVETVSMPYPLWWLSGNTHKESSVPVHIGPSYCQHDICIGPPDLAQIAAVPIASDIRDSVSFYLDAAPLRSDIYYFCIYHHATPVGQIILHDIDWQTGESLIGYHIFLPEYRGRGVGTSALALLQRYVRSMRNLTRLFIITSRDNQASQRVAIKCGFELIGPAREDPDQLLVFAWDVPHIITG